MGYQYQYVRVEFGGGAFFGNQSAEHRKVIDQYAADGWRYVGWVPVTFTSHGGVESADLGFEKPAEQAE